MVSKISRGKVYIVDYDKLTTMTEALILFGKHQSPHQRPLLRKTLWVMDSSTIGECMAHVSCAVSIDRISMEGD